MIEYEKGMLVVAFPNLNQNDTEFAFSYWMGPKVNKTVITVIQTERENRT